jgi:RNA polymerase sigma-70 factor (ECF subfamily)
MFMHRYADHPVELRSCPLNRSLAWRHLYFMKPQGDGKVHQEKAGELALDDYLVASARLGDRKALALLAERWNRKLLAHGWRLLGDQEAAKDAVQDAWAEITRGIAKLDDVRAFPAWAYRIVSRRCAKLIRGGQRRRLLGEAISAEPAARCCDAEDATDMEKLRAAIRALPCAQRAAVALFHLEEMSAAQVAVALGVPAGTVKTRLMHARRKLRAVLKGEP